MKRQHRYVSDGKILSNIIAGQEIHANMEV